MNLVKIAEDLKGVPLQALQGYVNGQNPEVPPYVAAAEMQRRQAQMQRAQMAQGAQQAGAPSVKEQLEEAVGLMSLQQQRQQQAMQQVAQQGQNRPMPTTEGTPQPVGMAGGGIARIPIRDEMFQYAGGGIIGFQEGGQPRTSGQRMLQDFKRWLESSAGAERERRIQQLKESLPAQMFEAVVGFKAGPEITYRPAEGAPSIYASPEERAMQAEDIGLDAEGAPPAEMPEAPVVEGIPSAEMPYADADRMLKRYPAPPTPGMASREQGIGAALEQPAPEQKPSMQQEALGIMGEYMRAQPKEFTPEMAGESEGKLYQQSGLAGLEGERRKMREEYEATKKGRPIDTAIATLAGAARGYGGVASGYLGAKRAQEARDREFLADMYQREAAPAEKRYGTQSTLFREGKSETEAARQRRLEAATGIAGAKGTTPTTETERLMAQVSQLRAEGRNAEAQALIDLSRSLKFAGDSGMTADQVKKLAFEAANSALKNGEIERGEIQQFVQDYMTAWQGASQQAAPAAGATSPTATTMPSSPKALADQLKKQLGR